MWRRQSGTDGRGGDATKGPADERDHLVALGEAISVVTAVGGDVAVAGGVVEWGLAGLATCLLSAENLPEQLLFCVAKRQVVAFCSGGGAALPLRATAKGIVAGEGSVALDLIEHMGA